MTTKKGKTRTGLNVNREEFNLSLPGDFPRVDSLCRELLLRFYEELQSEGVSPEEATPLASGADYFLRDFVVDFKGFNLFDEMPGIVRQFAGNWYITRTLEPNLEQLGRHLQGISAFYGFLQRHGLISAGYLRRIEEECADLAYYERRIATFWEIAGDGFAAWERECTLKEGSGQVGRA